MMITMDPEEASKTVGAGVAELSVDDGRDGLVVGTARIESVTERLVRVTEWLQGPYIVENGGGVD